MKHTLLAIATWGTLIAACSAQGPLRKVVPNPIYDSSAAGYFVIDSDDPSPLRPKYAFVDTAYQPAAWRRIYPGPRSVPASAPQAPCWRSISGDTTDNTFAGPIPIGFHFNFYGTQYDSIYLSSNGYVGFGNFSRAIGGDGLAYSTYAPGILPNPAAPRAIAAFMMTDGEMVRTPADSSRCFYRTSASADSFFITVYNFYHVSGVSTAGFTHLFRFDVQIVIAAADSSITLDYRKFNGVGVIGVEPYSAENLFRIGCIPDGCTSLAGVIGVQNEAAARGTTYLANGAFMAPGNVADLHSGLAVKFRRWADVCRVDSIFWPPPNFEILAGDSISPSAVFQNVARSTRSFDCMLRMRNAKSGAIVFSDTARAMAFAPGETRRIVFHEWRTRSGAADTIGRIVVEAIALPFANGTQPIGDAWPTDDTLRETMFVLQPLDSFACNNNDFAAVTAEPGTIPNPLRWVNIGAAVVDGDVFTYSPPPPRGKQGDTAHFQLNSPVIQLDRRSAQGFEYDRCAFGGIAPVGDGGVGDTLISFPIDITRLHHPVLSFSYERSGKKTYPRWYDLGTGLGPERTVTDPAGNALRSGDSLEVAFADSGAITNITKWHEQWAMDGGKDFEFGRAFLPIDSSFATKHFRFRVRLKAKNDFESGHPSDDYDEWFVDNFAVYSDDRPEIEISYVRIGPNWPYERVPPREATRIPIELAIANNGGAAASAFGVRVTVTGIGDPSGPVYDQLLTIPGIRPASRLVITCPTWNNRLAGPGAYVLNAFLSPKGYDTDSQNDSTYCNFTVLWDSCYGYDNGVNDVPGFFQIWGLGLRLPEVDPTNPIGASSAGSPNSGTIAVHFTCNVQDTVHGVMLWLGSANQGADAMRISLFKGHGAVPGDTIATFTTVRTAPWDSYVLYEFPGTPLLLDPGDYWLGVSQLGGSPLQLGAAAYRSSCDWTVYDSTTRNSDQFVLNYPDMAGLFAYENTAGSGNWNPFYFPGNDGPAAYSYATTATATHRQSISCGKSNLCLSSQGSWIPLIRPYFGAQGLGLRRSCDERLDIPRSALDFGTFAECDTATRRGFIRMTSIGADAAIGNLAISGLGANAFQLVGNSSVAIAPGTFRDVLIEAHRFGIGQDFATLQVWLEACSDTVPISPTYAVALAIRKDTVDIVVPFNPVTIPDAEIGSSACIDVPIRLQGLLNDTIANVEIMPPDSGFAIAASQSPVLRANGPNTLRVCFTPKELGVKRASITVTTHPCNRIHTFEVIGSGVLANAINTSPAPPHAPALLQNRPNPFSDETTIDFDLPSSARVRLVLTDVLGRERVVVIDENLSAGHHSRAVAGRGLAAGAYVCTLTTSSGVARRVIEVAR